MPQGLRAIVSTHSFITPLLSIVAVAVNGQLVHSWNVTEYSKRCPYLTYNNNICVLWDDESWANSPKDSRQDVEIAFRLRGEGGRNAMIAMTHVYYA